MIKVNIKSDKDNNIKKVFVSGHSNYAEAGKDIVCAAVSTAMYMSVNLVDKFCSNYSFETFEASATMNLEIIETNEETNIVLNNLVSTLEGIEEDYAKYVKIKFEK